VEDPGIPVDEVEFAFRRDEKERLSSRHHLLLYAEVFISVEQAMMPGQIHARSVLPVWREGRQCVDMVVFWDELHGTQSFGGLKPIYNPGLFRNVIPRTNEFVTSVDSLYIKQVLLPVGCTPGDVLLGWGNLAESAPFEEYSGRSSARLERLVWDQEVAGSNPVAPTKKGSSEGAKDKLPRFATSL
jgi:hypothetical protein